MTLTKNDYLVLTGLEKSGDFGLYNSQPGDEVSHLSDAELLAKLESEGDFGTNTRKQISFTTKTSTIFIQMK